MNDVRVNFIEILVFWGKDGVRIIYCLAIFDIKRILNALYHNNCKLFIE